MGHIKSTFLVLGKRVKKKSHESYFDHMYSHRYLESRKLEEIMMSVLQEVESKYLMLHAYGIVFPSSILFRYISG